MAKSKVTEENTTVIENEDESTSIITKNTRDDDDNALYLDQSVDNNAPAIFFHPACICGRCEACGTTRYEGGSVKKTILKNGEINHQYVGGQWQECDATNCKHYKPLYDRGMAIQCMYCKERFTGLRNSLGQFAELLATRIVYICSSEREPKKLMMYCDGFECKQKHFKRMNNGI